MREDGVQIGRHLAPGDGLEVGIARGGVETVRPNEHEAELVEQLRGIGIAGGVGEHGIGCDEGIVRRQVLAKRQ